MTQLLVSVRSAAEAEAALAGGAQVIDVKEPLRGALGRADDAAIAAVVEAVAGRCPVSAALGELRETCWTDVPPACDRLSFVKWGPAGYLGCEDAFRTEWTSRMKCLREGFPHC